MVWCAACGQDNPKSAKFCRNCGSTLIANPAEPKRSSPPRNVDTRQSVGFGDRRTGESLVIHCSLCGGQDFAQDSGRLDSKWGFTSFKVVMLTCKNCGHIELFNKGRSIFDFD